MKSTVSTKRTAKTNKMKYSVLKTNLKPLALTELLITLLLHTFILPTWFLKAYDFPFLESKTLPTINSYNKQNRMSTDTKMFVGLCQAIVRVLSIWRFLFSLWNGILPKSSSEWESGEYLKLPLWKIRGLEKKEKNFSTILWAHLKLVTINLYSVCYYLILSSGP